MCVSDSLRRFSGAREMIFMKSLSRSSRATRPENTGAALIIVFKYNCCVFASKRI